MIGKWYHRFNDNGNRKPYMQKERNYDKKDLLHRFVDFWSRMVQIKFTFSRWSVFPLKILARVIKKRILLSCNCINVKSQSKLISIIFWWVIYKLIFTWSYHCIVNKVVQCTMRAQILKFESCLVRGQLWLIKKKKPNDEERGNCNLIFMFIKIG